VKESVLIEQLVLQERN